MIDVVDLALERVSAVAADDNSSNETLRCTAVLAELQLKYDRLRTQLTIVTLECGTWR